MPDKFDIDLATKVLAGFATEKKAFVPMPGGQQEPVAGASPGTEGGQRGRAAQAPFHAPGRFFRFDPAQFAFGYKPTTATYFTHYFRFGHFLAKAPD